MKLDEARKRDAESRRPLVAAPSARKPNVKTNPSSPRRHGSERNLGQYESKAAELGAELTASWVFNPDSIFSTTASSLLEAMESSRRLRKKDSHWLCEVLWGATEQLSGASLADLTAGSVTAICRKAKLPWFVSKIIGQVAGRVIEASVPGSFTHVAHFLKVVVALICPDPGSCSYGTKALNFLLEPGVEATLRDLVGTTGPNPITA